jgi:glycerophosphoryl diester phosphodiesterase
MNLIPDASEPGAAVNYNMNPTLNCAHRGSSGHAPENTIAAVELAIAQGADMAEIDIQQTADDRFAVFHDEKLDRTTNGAGPLWKRSLAELQALDAGSWFAPRYAGERIPCLEEIVEITRGRLPLNIELKLHGHERRVVDLVIRAFRDNNIEDHCLVTCFDHRVAAAVKQAGPGLTVGAILGKQEKTVGVFTLAVDVLSAEKSLVGAAFMAAARAAGKRVHVWTVDEPAEMIRLIDLGADAVITNYPDRFPGSQEGQP